MPTVLPLYDDGDDLSPIAGAPIVGGQLVSMSADKTVSPSAAGAVVFGVALQDQPVAGQIVRITRNGIWPLVAATAVVAGDLLIAAANGQCATVPVSGAAYAVADATNSRAIFAEVFKGAAAGGTCYAALRIT